MNVVKIITPEELHSDDFEWDGKAWRTKPNGFLSLIPVLKMFGKSGFISNEVHIWYDTNVVAKAGDWSVDYSSANFSTPPVVIPIAHAAGSDAGDGNYASILSDTVTRTTCSGRANNAVTAGLLVAATNTNADCTLTVIAIGVP